MTFHPAKFALIACIAVPAAVLTWSHRPVVQAKPSAPPEIHYRWMNYPGYCGISELTGMQAVAAFRKDDRATLRGLLMSGQAMKVEPGSKVYILAERPPMTHVEVTEGTWVNRQCWVVTNTLTGGSE